MCSNLCLQYTTFIQWKIVWGHSLYGATSYFLYKSKSPFLFTPIFHNSTCVWPHCIGDRLWIKISGMILGVLIISFIWGEKCLFATLVSCLSIFLAQMDLQYHPHLLWFVPYHDLQQCFSFHLGHLPQTKICIFHWRISLVDFDHNWYKMDVTQMKSKMHHINPLVSCEMLVGL